MKIAGIFYDFTSVDSFSIVYKWEEPIHVRLNLNKKWLRTIDLKIDWDIVNDVKWVFGNFIEELPKTELSFTEKMIKLLKL